MPSTADHLLGLPLALGAIHLIHRVTTLRVVHTVFLSDNPTVSPPTFALPVVV